MGCLLAIGAWFFPRLVIILLTITGYIQKGFHGQWIWPVLGFFLMPFTTLAYAFSVNHGGGIQGIYVVLVLLAVLLDFGVVGGTAKKRGRSIAVVRNEHR